MMKTSLLRQVRLCRAALSAASRVQIASQPFPSASTLLSSIPRTLSAPCRTASGPLLRLYSSTAEAPIQDDKAGRVTKFENLTQLGVNERIIRNIVEDMGYKDMTDVQSMTINAALDGKDLVAQAKTGTGKTLAFLVPIIQRIIAQSPELAGGNRSSRFAQPARSDDIRAIIVSPTRELAEQIAAEAKRLVRGTGIKVQCAVGGTRKRSMLLEAQRYGCHLLVATPGRLNDLLSDPTSRIAAPNLQALVLDEADRMLDQGFQKDLDAIVDMLPDRGEVPRQTLLFSATIPHNVISLARTYINEQNFDFVQTVSPDDVATHEKVPQHIVPCRGFENVFPTLLELIEKESAEAAADSTAPPFKAIVFLQTTASVVLMHSMFQRIAFHNRSLPQAFDIHSKLGQSQRTHNSQKFRSSTSSVLFSSDVTARGMDFPNVTHVIQVHLPISRDQYIHRVGRTGRAGKGGEGWLIVSDMEVPLARRRLQGLPIKRSTDLVCATADVTAHGQELPDQFAAIKEAVSRLPPHLIRETYTSLLGGALAGNDPQSIVDEVNNMALHSWGLPEIPAVTPNMARNLGRVKGLRVESLPPRDHAFGHGRTGGFGSGRGGPGGGRLDRIFGSDDRRGGAHRGSHGGRDRGFGGRDDGYRGRGRSHDGPSF